MTLKLSFWIHCDNARQFIKEIKMGNPMKVFPHKDMISLSLKVLNLKYIKAGKPEEKVNPL